MTAQTLIILGALIFGVLGIIHLVYTFFTTKFAPRDPEVAPLMQQTTLRLTRETTVWNAWIGFNASHSLGAILFAVLYLLLAGRHMESLIQDHSLVWIAVAFSMAYLYLAWRYWFRIPLIGIAAAAACFLVSAILLS